MASMSIHVRIALAAALTLCAALWAAQSALRDAGQAESGEAAATSERKRSAPKSREAGYEKAKRSATPPPSATTASDLSTVFNADSSTRYESELRLDEANEAARRRLVERQALRLRDLADQAERSGNSERARLMRARVAYLEDRERDSKHSP